MYFIFITKEIRLPTFPGLEEKIKMLQKIPRHSKLTDFVFCNNLELEKLENILDHNKINGRVERILPVL